MKKVLRRSLDSTQIADLMASIFKVIVLSVGVFIALDFMGLTNWWSILPLKTAVTDLMS